MTDPRGALVALILERFRAAETYMDLPRQAGLLADAIQAAGWTPPGEGVKPSEADVARALAELNEDTDWEGGVESYLPDARAVLALFPGRTEAEVKAEAWDEAVDTLSRHWEDFAPAAVADLERRNPYRKVVDRG